MDCPLTPWRTNLHTAVCFRAMRAGSASDSSCYFPSMPRPWLSLPPIPKSQSVMLQSTGTSLMTSDRRLAGAPARSSRSDSACRTPAYGRLSLVRKTIESRRHTSAYRSAELRPQPEGTCSSTPPQSTRFDNVHSVRNPSRRTRASLRLQGGQ